MSESGIFRPSVTGFDRKEVLAHIQELMASHNEDVARLSAELLHVRKQEDIALRVAQATKQQAAEHLERLERLQGEYDRLQEEFLRLKGKADSLEETAAENARLKEELARQREAAQSAGQWQAQLEQLRAQEQVQQERLRRQAEEMEQLKAARAAVPVIREDPAQTAHALASAHAEIGRLAGELEDARRQAGSADAAVESADQQEMERLRLKTEELERSNRQYLAVVGNVSDLIADLRGLAGRYLEGAIARVKADLSAAEQTVDALTAQLGNARGDLAAARGAFDRETAESENRIENLLLSLVQINRSLPT